MRSALQQRATCDDLFRRVLAESSRQRVTLRHFERAGAKSIWGGNVSSKTGVWQGRNLLGCMMMELAPECAQVEDGLKVDPPETPIGRLSRAEQIDSWRRLAAHGRN
jgi:hypothetical protein